MTTNTDTTAASGAASLGPIQRFNLRVGIVNPEANGLYVRYVDHVDHVEAARAAAPAAQEAEPATQREFANELGNRIRIVIEGPTSVSENVLTPNEVAQLRCALNDHATRQRAYADAPTTHPDDIAVDRFAAAMKDKLAAACAKGRGGWETAECTQEMLSTMLREHVEKGDPRDVANFCAFLWNRGESIVGSAPRPQADAGAVPAAPEGWRLVPVDPSDAMLEVFNASDAFFVRYNKANHASSRYEVVHRRSLEIVGAFADDDEADAWAARLSYAEHYRALLAAAPQAPAAPTAAAASDEDEALDLLDALFAAWEDGTPCCDEPDSAGSFLGNAFRLDDATFHRCVDLLERRRSRQIPAAPAPAAGAAPTDARWWRKRADEIELAVALSGSTEAMRYYTDMRTLLQAVSLRAAAPAPDAPRLIGVDMAAGPDATAYWTAEPAPLTQAVRDVLAERRRQVEIEGFTPKHDDQYPPGTMARAAACYATINTYPTPTMWPWAPEWWKPRDDRSNYVRAAALLLAELERHDRAAARARQEGGAA